MLRASEGLRKPADGFVLSHVVMRAQNIDGVNFLHSHDVGMWVDRESSQHTGSDGSEGHALEKVTSEHHTPNLRPILAVAQ